MDVTAPTSIEARLYDGATYLTGITFTLPGETPSLSDAAAERISDSSVRISFRTNKTKDTCFKVYKSGSALNSGCMSTAGESNLYADTGANVFADAMYRVELYESGASTPVLASDILYVSPDPDTSSIPLKILDSDSIASEIIFSKVKDFSGTYVIDGTPVRYAARMKIPGKPFATQSSADGSVEVQYASGQTLYIGGGWDFTLNRPIEISSSSSGNTRTVEL